MTSPDDRAPAKPPPTFTSISPLHVPKLRSPFKDQTPQASSDDYTFPSSSTPVPSVLHNNAASENVSRSSSPNGRLSDSTSHMGRASVAIPPGAHTENCDDLRSLFVRAFSPAVAVFASPDTNELAQRKGFNDGFRALIRPYGERVRGKVVVRDSVGASRGWEDFGIRFVELGGKTGNESDRRDYKLATPFARLEELLERYLELPDEHSESVPTSIRPDNAPSQLSPHYRLFLRRLLSAHTFTPHETLLHPVACVIAISSRVAAPIETLRQLYTQTAQGSKVLPPYANPEYLRYYVLVHDEDRDDFATSSALFDQMKRHFGLHCHLLRLRSDQCLPSDDDSVGVPLCAWMSPSEDLARLENADNLVDIGTAVSHIFDSDMTAIQSFIRELSVQSVVPHMENRIALWNEQIASRRRGISGRFMSLSKRWTGIGAGSRSSPTSTGAGSGASGNYDSISGIYRADTPEALLRKLADYALMLRDYKLAASTYELLRTDYGNDKAWKYLAGANEMCAISNLLNPLAAAVKTKVEALDQMIEAASYSYLTRSSDPQDALRCIVMSVELLQVRGRVAAEVAAKWAVRILELGLVGAVGHVLLSERVASCYASQISTASSGWVTRKRKAALWNVMAADEWMKLGKAEFAAARLEDADVLYSSIIPSDGRQSFHELSDFLQQLQLAVRMKLGQSRLRGASGASRQKMEDDEAVVEEGAEFEQLDHRSHRRSLIGAANPLEAGSLSPMQLHRPDSFSRTDDDFE